MTPPYAVNQQKNNIPYFSETGRPKRDGLFADICEM